MSTNERKGHISVNTQDILPIIKKWLYSEHDIFLRELVSNSMDAITKRSQLSQLQNREIPAPEIIVEVNKELKTISVIDNGLGMSEKEVEKYLAQLAFSGAREFVEKYHKTDSKGNGVDIIGKFGLGFYSSFMVAHKVEVESLSMEDGAVPTKWISNGESEYTFTSSDYSKVGTKITLFLNNDSEEFLDSWKTRNTLTKYCDFMSYPIFLRDLNEIERKAKEKSEKKDTENKEADVIEAEKPINDTHPLWKKDPTTLKDEDYINFYRHLYPMDTEPLFWLHLNVDHPFNMQGILFFPKINRQKPIQEKGIKLYSKQVFVSDNIKDIIPEFLTLLKGTIDSSDIPLNVSRSSLQGDPNIKKISNYIIKKVAESLKKLFNTDRSKYEKIWKDVGVFVKFGCISDVKFDEYMREFVIYPIENDKFVTFKEYQNSVPESYKEKLKGKIVYGETNKFDVSLRNQLVESGISCVETEGFIDPHYISHVEYRAAGDSSDKEKEDTKIKFLPIDNALDEVLIADNVSQRDLEIKDFFIDVLAPELKAKEKKDSENKEEEHEAPKDFDIEVKSFNNQQIPAYIKIDENSKRMQQMYKSMGNMDFAFPLKKTLVVNPSNPLVQRALKIWEKDESKKPLARKICHHVQDLATFSSDGLSTPNEKDAFVKRSIDLITELGQFVD